MAIPERDTVYTNDGTRTDKTIYSRESSSTGWFVGIIVALALLAIGYLVFSANSGPSTPAGTSVDVNNTPAVTAPADTGTTPAPTTGTETTPMAPAAEPAAPATTAPATETPAPATETAPAADATAPATEPAPATTSP
ncbi:MAG TPA: hypothetical protein VIN06_15030 [Devosia sp.]